MGIKQLYLIRHAKSDWSVPGLRDLERPLNKRGQRDAPMMARWLKEQGIRPEIIYSSPAVRVITTARAFAEILNYPEESIKTDIIIYGGDAGDILGFIKTFNDDYDRALLFGHNPDITVLAEKLTGKNFHNIPTCGIVAIGFSNYNSWSNIQFGNGQFLFYKYPKMFKTGRY